VISSLVFTAVVLLTTVFATFAFYPTSASLEDTWLEYWYFLAPYALLSGTAGGYLGFSAARDTEAKEA
jgi:hypothetical protein